MHTIRFIEAEQTHDLRSRVMRPGRPLEECIYPEDDAYGAFHLGCFDGDRITGIASFSQENVGGIGMQNAYRLRGMAVEPSLRGQGIGTAIINFAIEYLASRNCDVLWCNARSTAADFYRSLGFETFSDEFDVPNIGPHYRMKKDLQKTAE